MLTLHIRLEKRSYKTKRFYYFLVAQKDTAHQKTQIKNLTITLSLKEQLNQSHPLDENVDYNKNELQ